MPHARLSTPPRHVEPEQQPWKQFDGLQAEVVQVPAVQAVPPQSRQARPPVPQDADELPVRQRAPMQHPEHEAAVHWQSPRRHSTPGSQAAPAPHAQPPPSALQLSAPMAALQGGPPAHPHRPLLSQPSVVSASHERHEPPPAPHDAALGEVMHRPVSLTQPLQPDIGAARMTVTGRSTPFTTTTRAAPSPTTAPPEVPWTEISTECWSSVSESSTRTDEVLGSGPEAVSGRSAGPKTPASPSKAL